MQTTSVGSDRSRAPFKTRAEITAIIQELGRAYEMGAISKQEYDAGMRNAFAAEDTAYRSGYVGPGAGIGAYRPRPDRQGEMNRMQDPAQNVFEPINRERVRKQGGFRDPMAENPVDRFRYGGAVRKYQEGGMVPPDQGSSYRFPPEGSSYYDMVTPDMVPPAMPNEPPALIQKMFGGLGPSLPLPPGNVTQEDMERAAMEADTRIANEIRSGQMGMNKRGEYFAQGLGEDGLVTLPLEQYRAELTLENLMNISRAYEANRINRERIEDLEYLRRQQKEDDFRALERNQVYNSTVGQRR